MQSTLCLCMCVSTLCLCMCVHSVSNCTRICVVRGVGSCLRVLGLQAAPTSKLVDCTKIEAYDVLKNAFSTLNANLTSANATIHAEDKKVCVHMHVCVFVGES